MTKPKIHIFEDCDLDKHCLDLAEQAVRRPSFVSGLRFNPFSQLSALYGRSSQVVLKYDEQSGEELYKLVDISSAKKFNHRHGITVMTSGAVAGIFCEIIKSLGYDKFKESWAAYVEDFARSGTAGNPFKVAAMISQAYINGHELEMPDRQRIVTLKLIDTWTKDLAAGRGWCESPANWGGTGKNLNKFFSKACGVSSSTISRWKKLERPWSTRDARKALLWCIASNTHPIKLLNFAGYYMTHKDSQPAAFAISNPETQPEEVQLTKGSSMLGYGVPDKQFSEGFIYAFASLISGISWFDNCGNKVEVISEGFLSYARCFDMQDFYCLGGIVWQELPLTKEGSDYYASVGMTTDNPALVKEITAYEASKMKRKDRDVTHEVQTTGNPLFDAELLAGKD